MSVEEVLVLPTAVFHEAGLFQGISLRVEHYLSRLLRPEHLRFLARPEAEQDPSFKQIIPYVVLRCRDQIFHYTRGAGGGEKRLQALRSIGVGGHINPIDHAPGEDIYRRALEREIEEEVDLETSFTESCLGLINDDSQPVGQVHLGIVHVYELAEPRVRGRDQNWSAAGFAPLVQLRKEMGEFETWSRFVLEALEC